MNLYFCRYNKLFDTWAKFANFYHIAGNSSPQNYWCYIISNEKQDMWMKNMLKNVQNIYFSNVFNTQIRAVYKP